MSWIWIDIARHNRLAAITAGLISVEPLETKFSEIGLEFPKFPLRKYICKCCLQNGRQFGQVSFKKIHLKILTFCSGNEFHLLHNPIANALLGASPGSIQTLVLIDTMLLALQPCLAHTRSMYRYTSSRAKVACIHTPGVRSIGSKSAERLLVPPHL